MKKLFVLITLCFFLNGLTHSLSAQSQESRNKIEMVIDHGGKTINISLNSLATSITRYTDPYAQAVKDSATVKSKIEKSSNFYLSLEVKKTNSDLMKLLANKEIRFNGSITLTDTYGKNPTRVIKFKDAKIETYSDQFSDMSYNDNYGAAVISITSSKLNIDGIEIEP